MKKNVNDKQYNPTASFDAMTINGLKQLGITNCSTIMLYSIIQSFSKKQNIAMLQINILVGLWE